MLAYFLRDGFAGTGVIVLLHRAYEVILKNMMKKINAIQYKAWSTGVIRDCLVHAR